MSGHWLLWCLYWFCAIYRIQSGDWYFLANGLRKIDISMSRTDRFVDHRIFPLTVSTGVCKDFNHACRLEFPFKIDRDSVLILRAFNVSTVELYRYQRHRSIRSAQLKLGIRFRLRYVTPPPAPCLSNALRGWEYVHDTMLKIVPVSNRDRLSLELAKTSGHSKSLPGLRILLMEQRFCSDEITYFDSNCYMIGSDSRSMKDELVDIELNSRVAQLATFNSSSALQNFVKRSQRSQVGSGMGTHRKTPLDLSQSVRIALFYDGKNKDIYYQRRVNGKCEMAVFIDTHRLFHTLKSTRQQLLCGSLRVSGSDTPLVEFGDCDEPLPALLQFPDAGRNIDKCDGCVQAVLNWMESKRENGDNALEKPAKKPTSNLNTQKVVNLTTTVCLVVICFIVIASMWYKKRTQPSNLSKHQTHYENEPLLNEDGSEHRGTTPVTDSNDHDPSADMEVAIVDIEVHAKSMSIQSQHSKNSLETTVKSQANVSENLIAKEPIRKEDNTGNDRGTQTVDVGKYIQENSALERETEKNKEPSNNFKTIEIDESLVPVQNNQSKCTLVSRESQTETRGLAMASSSFKCGLPSYSENSHISSSGFNNHLSGRTNNSSGYSSGLYGGGNHSSGYSSGLYGGGNHSQAFRDLPFQCAPQNCQETFF